MAFRNIQRVKIYFGNIMLHKKTYIYISPEGFGWVDHSVWWFKKLSFLYKFRINLEM